MGNEEPARVYRLTPPVDFHTTLELLGDDHLVVDPERMLVIFRKAVLNLEVEEGDLETAAQVTIEVLDAPQSAASEAPLVERFLEQVATTTGTEWVERPAT